MAGILCRAERELGVAAAVGVGFTSLESWFDGRRCEAGVVGDASDVDGVAGVMVCFLVAPPLMTLAWSISSPVLSLSRSMTGITALPALTDAFDFELALKSINLGLTIGGSDLPDSELNESTIPTPLGDE